METNVQLKNSLGESAVKKIARVVKEISPEFKSEKFIKDSLNGIENLELKERVYHIIHILWIYFPHDFSKAAEILNEIPKNWKKFENDEDYGFAAWPLIDYVGVYGINHPKESLKVLKSLTHLFSAEFAIRPFMKNHYQLTYETMLKWSKDESEHVRRLASEGIRPRLPWGERLNRFIKDPKPILNILENLKDDESEYVRRSVANNLNDISKDHPELVTEVCNKWLKNSNKNRLWITKHATRSLIKEGYSDALELLGYTKDPKIILKEFMLSSDKLVLGDELIFSFEIASNASVTQKLVIDYVIHFMKQNGRTSGKVFKMKNVELSKNASKIFIKKHKIKNITTRKYYSGKHKLDIMINGKVFKEAEFELTV